MGTVMWRHNKVCELAVRGYDMKRIGFEVGLSPGACTDILRNNGYRLLWVAPEDYHAGE